ncbi:DUF2057 family protein [Vibrio sinaloensis]|uniref:DUF2057 family protein n=1 Tax=Photobacterium sp. (strain ATCC 43367) TaxID=379097 RepID=UPI002067BA42|nr:DUF2057 family protein [Vibrio sinaloensis]UPQ90231.1 DUF2057 family protein [Vibrio sinaloensis]
MKINTTIITAIAALGICGYASAEVTITVPDTIEVFVANGAKPKLNGGFFDANKTLTLPDGENQIVFSYQPYFDQGKDRIILRSHPQIATFTTSNSQLEFNMPTYRNADQGSKQIGNLEWSLIDQQGIQIDTKQDQLKKDGLQIGRNIQLELAEYNRNGNNAAALAPVVAASSVPAAAKNTQEAVTDTTAEEMLHFWYNKADAKTQARFKDYINSQ